MLVALLSWILLQLPLSYLISLVQPMAGILEENIAEVAEDFDK